MYLLIPLFTIMVKKRYPLKDREEDIGEKADIWSLNGFGIILVREVDMDRVDEEFLRYWFGGFIKGMENVDEKSQETVLRACGVACAQSYTEQVFQEAKQNSEDLQGFLTQLARRFRGARYESTDEHTISVRYRNCGCDLVINGWVKSPMLCKCSAGNLQRNFEASLGIPVQVKLISSILGGGKECVFEVLLCEEHEQF